MLNPAGGGGRSGLVPWALLVAGPCWSHDAGRSTRSLALLCEHDVKPLLVSRLPTSHCLSQSQGVEKYSPLLVRKMENYTSRGTGGIILMQAGEKNWETRIHLTLYPTAWKPSVKTI